MKDRIWTEKDFARCYEIENEDDEKYELHFAQRIVRGIKKNKLAMMCVILMTIICIASFMKRLLYQ